jgi:hypothetical protein
MAALFLAIIEENTSKLFPSRKPKTNNQLPRSNPSTSLINLNILDFLAGLISGYIGR